MSASDTETNMSEITDTKPPLLPSEEDDAIKLRSVFFGIQCDREASQATKNVRMSRALLDALHERGNFFYHTDMRDFQNAMYFDKRRKLLLWIDSDEFKSWLSSFTGVNMSSKLFGFMFSDIQTEALSGRTSGIMPEQFWANRPGAIYISNGRGGMVKIVPSGIEPCDNGTDGVLFSAGYTLSPWEITNPVDPFESCSVWSDAAYTHPHGKDLFRLWALSIFTGQRCKPPIVMSGPIGSGKSRTIYGLFDLLGIPARISAVTENGEDNFWVSLSNGGLCCLDNADSKTKWLPDALAAAATDGSHERRRLYTDHAMVMLRARSWLAITSANPTFASDSAVADRVIVVRLNQRPTGSTAESTLTDQVLAARNAGLSWLAITLQKALADTADAPPVNRRHPDFSSFAVKIGRAIGREQEAISAMQAAEADKSLFNLENDCIGQAILDYFASDDTGLTTSFSGTAKELLEELQKQDSFFREWTSKRLSNHISRIWPHLSSHLTATKSIAHGGASKFTFHKPQISQ